MQDNIGRFITMIIRLNLRANLTIKQIPQSLFLIYFAFIKLSHIDLIM